MSGRRPPLTVLIPDGEGQWALRAMRSIAADRPVRSHVISPWSDDIARHSRYCGSYRVRPANLPPSDQVDLICRTAREVGAEVILPTSVDGIHFCSRYRVELSRAARLPPLPTPDALKTVNDKWTLAQALLGSVPQPHTIHLEPLHAEEGALGAFPFPALLKPRVSAGGEGIVSVQSSAELSGDGDWFNGNYILQSFVDGVDVGCSMLADRGKVIALTTQRAVLRSGTPHAPPVGVDVQPIAAAEESGRRFAAHMEWSGLVNIDMRLDAEGVARIIDVNPRFWGSMLASTAAGVNFAHITCLMALGEPVGPVAMRPTRFMGTGAALQQVARLLAGRKAVVPGSFRNTWAPFICRDPLPNLVGRLGQLRRGRRSLAG